MSLFEITNRDLVERAVRNAKPSQAGPAPRWVAVMDTFALGSGYAYQLCRDFDLDPEESSTYEINCISCNP